MTNATLTPITRETRELDDAARLHSDLQTKMDNDRQVARLRNRVAAINARWNQQQRNAFPMITSRPHPFVVCGS